jgi:formylglycine-generating enzyme required for sulfatase activity
MPVERPQTTAEFRALFPSVGEVLGGAEVQRLPRSASAPAVAVFAESPTPGGADSKRDSRPVSGAVPNSESRPFSTPILSQVSQAVDQSVQKWYRLIPYAIAVLLIMLLATLYAMFSLELAQPTDTPSALIGATEQVRKAAAAARLAEQQGKVAAAARLAEQQGKVAEAARLAEQQRKVAEAARLAEQQGKVAEAARLAEQQGKVAEAAHLAEQQRKADEARHLAATQGKAAEEAQSAAEQDKAAECLRLIEAQRIVAEAARAAIEQRRNDPANLARIAALLAGAGVDRTALRLTGPRGANAVEKYREVLVRDPDNAQAKAGLVMAVEHYVTLANKAVVDNRFVKASSYLERAAGVLPDAEVVKIARDALQVAQQARQQSVKILRPGTAQSSVSLPAFRDALENGSKGPEMLVIPAGSFRMGDLQGGGFALEKPVHPVRIERAFALGRSEVTFEDYDRFVQVVGGVSANDKGRGRAQRPVINVSWDDANAYAKWLSAQTGKRYRLPSEAEYAARAATQATRYWGNSAREACRYANVHDVTSKNENTTFFWSNHECDDGTAQTATVGKFVANAFGLRDMLGNVEEWTADCWHETHSGAPQNQSARSDAGGCGQRVSRGGSWGSIARRVRSAARNKYATGHRADTQGFRLARDMWSMNCARSFGQGLPQPIRLQVAIRSPQRVSVGALHFTSRTRPYRWFACRSVCMPPRPARVSSDR